MEEFVFARAHSAQYLSSALWRLRDQCWTSSATVSRDIRTDADQRARVVAGNRGAAVGPLLRRLTTHVREQGLIPVTVERLS